MCVARILTSLLGGLMRAFLTSSSAGSPILMSSSVAFIRTFWLLSSRSFTNCMIRASSSGFRILEFSRYIGIPLLLNLSEAGGAWDLFGIWDLVLGILVEGFPPVAQPIKA